MLGAMWAPGIQKEAQVMAGVGGSHPPPLGERDHVNEERTMEAAEHLGLPEAQGYEKACREGKKAL